ncbi:hypothetical protein Pint_28935 [Pistacia integerrima]|uniref:Uncharacterized protein n=1 Tax=Pistacia integerrima TaxID=434235 RepID=A0ACC0X1C8_9ROSI|nr:hypothetical protein Pint_28935 [Pistacia integerrima]
MAKSCNFSFFFFSLLLGHGVVELEASAPVYRNLKLSLSNPFQTYRTGYHVQPAKNWMNVASCDLLFLMILAWTKICRSQCKDLIAVSNMVLGNTSLGSALLESLRNGDGMIVITSSLLKVNIIPISLMQIKVGFVGSYTGTPNPSRESNLVGRAKAWITRFLKWRAQREAGHRAATTSRSCQWMDNGNLQCGALLIRKMAKSCIFSFFFFSLLLGHGVIELEASTPVYRNFKLPLSNPFQPYRTDYHFQPAKNWMNVASCDLLFFMILAWTNGWTKICRSQWLKNFSGPMFYKGIYHLFYQYNPEGATAGSGNLSWGHSTSTDLINWTPHEEAINPSQPYDINGCWSGSATILPGGKPAILYTGRDPNNKQIQNLALPKNLSDPFLIEWVKSTENPVMEPPEQIDPGSFRDPTTARLGPDDTWRVIIGSQFNNTGLAILYRSKDFVNWTKAEQPLHSEEETEMWECPDFFPVSNNSRKGVDTSMIGLNIRYVLKASISKTQHDCYMIGTYNVTADKFIPDQGSMDGVSALRYDYGQFYASKTFFDSAKNRRILWGWIIELSSEADNVKKGWAGLQAVPRSLWLDKSGKQLMQWPIAEVEKLRENPVNLPSKLLGEGSLLEVSNIKAAQADVEISFRITEFEKAEVMDPSWTDPESLCIQKGASVKGALGPFGLLVLASKNLKEYTAVFFRIFKNQNKYAVLMCSDQRSSSLDNDHKKTTYGAFLDVDPVHDKLSLRSLIDHSIVESFGGGGKACMTARVYPTMATDDEAHLYAFNYGTEKINITNLSAWSMKKARIN